MHPTHVLRHASLTLAALASLGLTACGGSDDTSSPLAETPVVVPAEPAGLGRADTAEPPAGVPAYVDTGATNQRGVACNATLETNAGVRVLKGFLDLWTPRSAFVDADQAAPAADGCAAVAKSDWDGVPGSATDGGVRNQAAHDHNIAYSVTVTQARTPAQELAAYLDDRRGKSYSISDALGPLTEAWRAGTHQSTTITAIAADATTRKYDDAGNNRGDGSATNPDLGKAVDLVVAASVDASTEPAKRYYKYARAYRWNPQVSVVPALVPAKSATPASDGGFPSGHTAEAWRDALTIAYLVPQRYHEMLARGMEMGENRILAGMHSAYDVMGGRVMAIAQVAFNLNKAGNATLKQEAYAQSQGWLQARTGAADFNALATLAHSAPLASDRFADHAANRADFSRRMHYGFPAVGGTALAASVPKGAEVLLETRQPYLSAAQRRVVLKSTAATSGAPVGNDDEGWGRVNLFAAADGYGRFDGDVSVTMDAARGGFHALDRWRNDIAGAGRLEKLGSGTLRLAGQNAYTGGTLLGGGTLAADSATALGRGDVFVKGGTLESAVAGTLAVGGAYTQTAGTLSLVMRGVDQGSLAIDGRAVIAGGKLVVSFAGYTPRAGDSLTVLQSAGRSGRFSEVSVAGFGKVTPIYTERGMQLRLEAR
ncbi:MAG: phosphatase PAP2 family protein [Candidatus Dactylopiibacterium sp.]|nr:phosphatase PAP2 family protein [Candidatus Dactylopiibacterium sp.]